MCERILSRDERIQRGCDYCLHVGNFKTNAGVILRTCRYDSCPFKELDKYKTFDEYCKSRY